MSKELDELLNTLLKEIPKTEKKNLEPAKPTQEAVRQAERIVQDVEQEKSWQIPPEKPKKLPPAPQHDPVVVPEPISHFTDTPSPNPAIRMRDRLDETALPKPDAERKPTQIMDVRPPIFKRKKKKRKKPVKAQAKEAAQPKRKIPHIVVPDELPPDIPQEQPHDTLDAEHQTALRSRVEQIREQLRRRTEEEAAAGTAEAKAPEKEEKLPPFEEAPSAEYSVEEAHFEDKPVRQLAVPEAAPVEKTDWRTLVSPEEETEPAPEAFSEPEVISEPEQPASSAETKPETSPEAPHGFAAALREAFDETAEELAEIKAEPLPDSNAYHRTHFLRRHSYFLAGIVCFVFAVLGLVTGVRWCWEKVQGFAGSATLRQTLEDVLYPAVVVDLPAFEAPGELDAGSLLTAAMVDILMYDDLSGYPESFGVISVPATDVLAKAQKIFGTDFQPEFDTLHAAGETFFYDKEGGCYNVPVSPVIFSYSPEVTDIRRSGDTCTCTVVYHSDLAKWQERSENFEDSNAKTMQVTLVKNGDIYQIARIANVQTGDGE